MTDCTRKQRPVELILPRLDGVEPCGAGWSARCPVHDDSVPSLSIGENSNGDALVHCFGGCSTPLVMDGIDLPMRALFAAGSRVPSSPRREPEVPTYTPLPWAMQARLYRAQKVLCEHRDVLLRLRAEKGTAANVAERAGLGWDADSCELLIPYVLGDGVTPAALDRWRFRPDRDDGRPSTALYGHPRPLYVPHAVLEEMHASALYVCEGPLDALAACSRGYAAVAAPSASTWKRDYAEWITDLHYTRVIVCGDCDPAGRAFANRAAGDLAEHDLHVQVLDLDADRDDGYDVGAHLLAGGRLP